MARAKRTVTKAPAKSTAKTKSGTMANATDTTETTGRGRLQRAAKTKAQSALDSYLESDVSDGKDKDENEVSKQRQATDEKSDVTADEVGNTQASNAPGFRVWKTGTKLVSGNGLTEVSQFDVSVSKFTQSVKVQYGEMFTLKPLIVSEGPMKGRRVLMLEPFTITEYFPFFDLPPELRKMIYDLVLLEPKNIAMCTHKPVGQPRRPVGMDFRINRKHKGLSWDRTKGKWSGQTPSSFALLFVSQRMLQETAPVAYGDNTFDFADMRWAKVFLTTIGNMRKYLKHIRFGPTSYRYSEASSVFNLLKSADSLRTITINHKVSCARVTTSQHYIWCRWHARVEDLVAQALPMLKTLHKAREGQVAAASVLDLFVVSNDDFACSVICTMPGTEQSGATNKACQEAIIARLRTAIAKELKIES